MSGADSPRWRQNRSESHLPHIITGLEHEYLVSLPSIALSLHNIALPVPAPSDTTTPIKIRIFRQIKRLGNTKKAIASP